MLWPPGFYGQRSQQDSGSARRVVATQTLTKPPPPRTPPLTTDPPLNSGSPNSKSISAQKGVPKSQITSKLGVS